MATIIPDRNGELPFLFRMLNDDGSVKAYQLVQVVDGKIDCEYMFDYDDDQAKKLQEKLGCKLVSDDGTVPDKNGIVPFLYRFDDENGEFFHYELVQRIHGAAWPFGTKYSKEEAEQVQDTINKLRDSE